MSAPATELIQYEWPTPQPLVAKGIAEQYPLDALPDGIKAAVEEVFAFVKAPPALIASSALSVLSLTCQALADVQRAERLQSPIGLFMLSIADSGERKTTCDNFFTQPIRRWQDEQEELLAPEVKRYAAEIDAWTVQREAILADIKAATKGTTNKKSTKNISQLKDDLIQHEHDKPTPPKIPKLLLGDETPENLAWGLAKKYPSAGVLSNEAGVVFGAHGMSKDSAMRNLGLLNILWDGGTLSVGRRTSESFEVKDARLTVGLMIQEPALQEFFAKSGALARGTGFLARFLVAWPESTQGYRLFTEAPRNWPHLEAHNQRITEILNLPIPLTEEGTLSPAVLSLTPEAKQAWVNYHDAIEVELAKNGELYDVRDVAAKTADNATRLAALFQIYESGGLTAISADNFDRASRIATWHLSESRRFFGELILPVEIQDAAKLDWWLFEQCQRNATDSVGKNDALQNGPAPTRKSEPLDAAIKYLAELDRVRKVTEGRRVVIKVNPSLLMVRS